MRALGSLLRVMHLFLLAMVMVGSRPGAAWTQDQPTTLPDQLVKPAPIPAKEDHLWTGWTLVAGSYAAIGGYGYYSWSQEEDHRDFFFKSDGWFGKDTYAGGADKVGHCFSNYLLTRSGYDILSWAGLSRDHALTASVALAALLYTAIEIKDGRTKHLGFSWNDIVADVCGNLLATALVLNPSLDRALDFRLEYYPTREYLDAVNDTGTLNPVEDYSGMTFGLWYHLSEVPGLKKVPVVSWLRFVDLGVTYGTRNYRPDPYDNGAPRQELSAALTLNIAAIVRALAGDHAHPIVSASNWIFEYFTIPGTTLKVR